MHTYQSVIPAQAGIQAARSATPLLRYRRREDGVLVFISSVALNGVAIAMTITGSSLLAMSMCFLAACLALQQISGQRLVRANVITTLSVLLISIVTPHPDMGVMQPVYTIGHVGLPAVVMVMNAVLLIQFRRRRLRQMDSLRAEHDRRAQAEVAITRLNAALEQNNAQLAERERQLMRKRFHTGQASAPEQIEAAAQAGDTELAVRLAHTLRGTAGTLGAEGLQRIAGELESALKNGDASWHTRLGETQAQRTPLIAALAGQLHGREAATGPVPGERPAFDATRLDTLAAQIDRFDSMATETVAILREALGAAAPRLLEEMDEHLNNFDFDSAAALLAPLREALA